MPIPVWAFTGTAMPRLSTLSKHLARDGLQLVVYTRPKDEARRMAANFAKLPELLRGRPQD